ncbi:MAG: hypothetical protein L6N95_02485 [Candidatus Methylarchaceae archaeon HK01B]|nr:hypothetical protein [Candidatus Methylarchaceae archaeon HK01B]
MSSKRNLSIGIISILILSAFTTATVPMTSAISDPYIIVYPSSVSPGQTVYVRGYHFEPGNIVDIYYDVVDEYHHLGSEVVNWYGRFYFSFEMEEGYPGTCTIIAVNPPDTYTEDIELSYTNPLDQRLVDLIGSLSIVEAKIDDIWGKVDELDSWFGTDGKYNNTTQIIAGSDKVTFPDQLYFHSIIDLPSDKTAKITITILTWNIDSGEFLDFDYFMASVFTGETIADGTNIYPPKTYEFCFKYNLSLYGQANAGSNFTVSYCYIVEYQP